MARIVIIGFGSAGYGALMTIKKMNPQTEAIIIDRKPFDLLHPCGLPYALEGHADEEKLTQDISLGRMNVKKIEGKAVSISTEKKTVLAETHGGTIEISYDSAIMATGSIPLIPPVINIEKHLGRGVYTLTGIDELSGIRKALHTALKGIIIGAGAIGLETAIALRQYLDRISIVEMKGQVLPGVLDADMSEIVASYLQDIKIELLLNAGVEEMVGETAFSGVMAGNRRIDGGICILSAGFRADTSLAEKSGVVFDTHGIQVDDRLRTSADHLYAAGDCVAGWSVIDGKRLPVKLATSAYRQGVVAGTNAAGGDVSYRGTAGTFVTRIGSIEIAGTGYTTELAKKNGYDPVAGKIRTGVLPDYMHGGNEITIKVLCDRKTGRLLGAQAVGPAGAAERINLVSMAIEFGIKTEDLMMAERAYCPAVSEVIDPLQKALEFAVRRMNR